MSFSMIGKAGIVRHHKFHLLPVKLVVYFTNKRRVYKNGIWKSKLFQNRVCIVKDVVVTVLKGMTTVLSGKGCLFCRDSITCLRGNILWLSAKYCICWRKVSGDTEVILGVLLLTWWYNNITALSFAQVFMLSSAHVIVSTIIQHVFLMPFLLLTINKWRRLFYQIFFKSVSTKKFLLLRYRWS
jgi:hypothetical protein